MPYNHPLVGKGAAWTDPETGDPVIGVIVEALIVDDLVRIVPLDGIDAYDHTRDAAQLHDDWRYVSTLQVFDLHALFMIGTRIKRGDFDTTPARLRFNPRPDHVKA